MPLSAFTPQVRDWFTRAFAEPTAAQAQAWPAIATGQHALISAPTGSGKTIAAFLWALDRLVAEPTGEDKRTRLVCATAWISSTMTHSVPRKISRAWLVSIRYSDSGVVMRMSGGWRTMSRRSFCGVSPVRMPTVMSPPMPRRGARRFFSMS